MRPAPSPVTLLPSLQDTWQFAPEQELDTEERAGHSSSLVGPEPDLGVLLLQPETVFMERSASRATRRRGERHVRILGLTAFD